MNDNASNALIHNNPSNNFIHEIHILVFVKYMRDNVMLLFIKDTSNTSNVFMKYITYKI